MFSPLRQVHISQATLDCLGGTFETEQGNGQDRSEFLRKHNIETYLIRPATRDEAQPPRARRPSYDELTTWSAELPFGDILGMNFVSCSGIIWIFFRAVSSRCFVLHRTFLDPGYFHQRFPDPVAESHCSAAIRLTGSEQEDSSGNGSSEQRANEERAHHHFHSGVQGFPDGGKGSFLH